MSSDDQEDDDYNDALNLSANLNSLLGNMDLDSSRTLEDRLGGQRPLEVRLDKLRSFLTEQRTNVNRLELLKEALLSQNEKY